jgi:transcription-repair coupling factor (superfamily II helicase)
MKSQLKKLLSSKKNIVIKNLWDSPKGVLCSWIQELTGKNILLVMGCEEGRLFDDVSYFCNGVVEFPAWETLPSEELPPSADVVGDRYDVLRALLEEEEKKIVITNLQACLQRVISPDQFCELCVEISVGKEVPFTELQHMLLKMGYCRRPIAVDKGDFAIRGGLVDIFPVNATEPVRIDFWGDEVDTIRIYDPVSQKSIGKIQDIFITPAKEFEFEGRHSIVDYLGDTIVIFDDTEALENRKHFLENIPGTISERFICFDDFATEIKNLKQIYWGEEKGAIWEHPFQKVTSLVDIGQMRYGGEDFLLGLSKVDKNIHFLCDSESEEMFLKKKMEGLDLNFTKARFVRGYLSSGYCLENDIFVPYTEISHRYKIRRQKRRGTYHGSPLNFIELAIGDIVVHINHGIGRYIGIENHTNHLNVDTEFMSIEYDGGARLYVPLTQAHLVSRYIGAKEEEHPRLHALGGKRWNRTRSVAEHTINDYAAQVLQIHAERSLAGGYAFPECSEETIQFEDDFPYQETDDQLRAIDSIKSDMLSGKPMDRLICGDVGYGKTEVAMRAAFKAVTDGGKQVAILVPTTILAMQHYDTLSERMEHHPVVVKALSRFQTTKETKETLAGLASGSVDIVIGTHRILSADVNFKDLGLLIIDEEQRFGVKAKDKLKATKTGVDCLTLTATPIPRTLYLSMAGARDMSPINTPPQDRLPIKTIVTPSKDKVIKNALLRELSRHGQSFVIHNRVETIHRFANKIEKLVPRARVLVAHGQMPPEEIDEIFHLFQHGEADILVATTILENGIDVPNANTIIIDRSDRFGLAALYQLRGRVGRWNRQAYAYCLTPSTGSLSPIAQRRLDVLNDLSGYGGGMKLALRDLEIRGAGDILGTEQSGQISNIGFHLYCKLLQRAISSLQGKAPPPLRETKMEFPYDARIPDNYVNEATLRMNIYQRFGEANNNEDIELILDEMKDRFGKPPEEVIWLYHIMRIRVFAAQKAIFSLKIKDNKFTFQQGKMLKTVPIIKSNNPKSFEESIILILNA